jgi:hypothetical protein
MDVDSNWGPKTTWHEENVQWFIMNDYGFPTYMSTINVINSQYKLNVRRIR